MGVFFVAALVPSAEAVAEERYALMRRGVQYSDWARMTRWQRVYHLRRVHADAQEAMRAASKGIGGLIGAVVAKLLG